MRKILVIDLGTTYSKISLFDGDGRLCDTCRIEPLFVTTPAGIMELAAGSFGETIARGIAELRDRNGGTLDDVAAVTFATQTNSLVLLDSENRSLTPLILWPDRRAEYLDAEVRAKCGIPGFAAMTGLGQLNFQCMVAKLLWVQDRMPDTWKWVRKLCLVSDYLTLLLTGKHATEAGAAGLTGLVDIHRCRWYPTMLANFNIDPRHPPCIVRAGTDVGPIDPQAANRFGLPQRCRFVIGCLDQYAGAIGVGNVEPGMISETTGTVLATRSLTKTDLETAGTRIDFPFSGSSSQLTSLINTWLSDNYTLSRDNPGILLFDASVSRGDRRGSNFYSLQCTNLPWPDVPPYSAEYCPQLIVTYTQAPEPGAFALLATGVIAIFFHAWKLR